MADFFGGLGDQWAYVFTGLVRLTNPTTINAALRILAVVRTALVDEFDTIGLGNHRSPPVR